VLTALVRGAAALILGVALLVAPEAAFLLLAAAAVPFGVLLAVALVGTLAASLTDPDARALVREAAGRPKTRRDHTGSTP
jgi:hypothetical protein